MDRRELLQAGAASAVAAMTLSKASNAFAQSAGGAATKPTKLHVDAYSRHLQWLRSPDQVAEACIEMAFDGLDITVRPYPGHVDPANVRKELPAFVNGIRRHGLIVDTITCPITDAKSDHAEAILDTASSLGIHHYWWGTYRYDLSQPIQPQLNALKPRVADLIKLNEKYGMKAMYHNYSGTRAVGSAIFDLLEILREFDPRYASFHYDTGHATEAGGNGTWEIGMRAAGPYIGGMSFKDSIFELDLPIREGGPFEGDPDDLYRRQRPPRGGQAAAAGAAAAPGNVAPSRPGSAPGNKQAPAAAAAFRRRPPLGRGGGGKPNPWRVESVPLGEGMVNLPRVVQVMKDINFQGPVEIQAEYPNGGANNARDRITLPRAMVLGAMKRDLLTLRGVMEPAGLI